MEIEVIRDVNLGLFDTGGGFREVRAKITIDDSLSPRMKRHTLIFETIGACLGFAIPHKERHELTDTLIDALDQLEGVSVE